VRDCGWHLQTGGSAVVAKCAAILRRHDLGVLADAVRSADVTPAVAVTIAAEFDKIAAELADGTGEAVLNLMIDMGAEHGAGSVRQLRELLLAQYGRDGAFQDEQDGKHRQVELSAGRQDAGVFRYELTVDAQGRAVLEAAIGPLSAPVPGPDGEPDIRCTSLSPWTICGTPLALVARWGRWIPAACWARKRCAGWRVTRGSFRWCWAGRVRCWRWAGPNGCSPPGRSKRCGCGIDSAPSRAATRRRIGAMRTT